jgi:hypothetical protein
VADDLDVAPVGVEHERAVVAGVVDALARHAVVGVAAAIAAAWNSSTVAFASAIVS